MYSMLVSVIFSDHKVKGCSSKSIVDWFWSLVNDLDENEKGLLLKFCTGSPRLPPGGFACLKVRFIILRLIDYFNFFYRD